MDRLKISWHGIVEQLECADQFLVKFWPVASPNYYRLSDMVNTDTFELEITVTPRVQYALQVIAREDKGFALGVDYNKGPVVKFKTSSKGGVGEGIR